MNRYIAIILIMAAVTYLPRAVPALVKKDITSSKFMGSFLYYIPFAALGALIFPGVLASTGNIWSAIIGSIIAIALALWDKNLILVVAGAVAAVYIFNIFI